MNEKKDAETQAREAWENVYSEAWDAAKARGVEYPDRVVEAMWAANRAYPKVCGANKETGQPIV
jgi:hypothetical protein